jgi:hypothetical protein
MENLTYDVHFNSGDSSNSKGFKSSIQECKDYINQNNGTLKSYFSEYREGTVSIICNETGETVHSEEVK